MFLILAITSEIVPLNSLVELKSTKFSETYLNAKLL